MRLTRVHVPGPLHGAQRYTLEAGAARHLSRVLRLAVGDSVTLFDGSGGEYAASISGIRRDAAELDVHEHRPVERESALQLTLLQGIPRGERMDWVVQKATELGVSAIVPLLSDHSVVSLHGEQLQKKTQHWRAIAISACEQSGRNRIPEIVLPCTLQQYLGRSSSGGAVPAEPGSLLLLSPAAAARMADIEVRGGAASVLIGPEGGLSEPEIALARHCGFAGVRLGPRVLRTETAAVSALTLLQHRWGDL